MRYTSGSLDEYRLPSEASREFGEAVDYHEDRVKGLGIEFVAEIYRGIELISQYPGIMASCIETQSKVSCKPFSLWIDL